MNAVVENPASLAGCVICPLPLLGCERWLMSLKQKGSPRVKSYDSGRAYHPMSPFGESTPSSELATTMSATEIGFPSLPNGV